LVRTPPPQPDWHEWGFFDYGALHPNLRSYHCDVLQFEPDEKYQVIYSICVLAHLTAAAREQVLSRCKSWLRPGGTLLVTFDVLRDTEFVWNLRLGEEFEPRSQHGTITGLMSGLDNLGFQINDRGVLRNVHGASSDLFLLACTV
jgi:predicted SAM-dependent methyltransferase